MQAIEDAAALLRGLILNGERTRVASDIIEQLGFGFALTCNSHISLSKIDHTAALFEAAARMSRIFRLDAPDAPGLVFVGGTADPRAYGLEPFDQASVGGRGLDIRNAFTSCIGENIEYLAQLEWGDEALEPGPWIECPSGLRPETFTAAGALLALTAGPAHRPIDLIGSRSLSTGASARIPADLCLRRQDPAARSRIQISSGGCAAGETLTQATVTALLELLERDAAALWWIGGRRGRPISSEVLQRGQVPTLLETLRAGNPLGRRTWLLDISSDFKVPCVAALSTDASGRDFACGLSARPTLDAAAQVALQELCQMELANRLVAQKLETGGEGALNAVEKRHLRRSDIDAAKCLLLHAAGPAAPVDDAPPASPEDQLAWLVDRLDGRGTEVIVVDLTRPALAIPSVRVLAPGLQALPARLETSRLRCAIAETGGGHPYTNGIDLL